jgi:hypothetical protein
MIDHPSSDFQASSGAFTSTKANSSQASSEQVGEEESSNLLIAHVVRSTFDAFADEIMSLYGSQKDEDRLENLSSTPIAELRDEHDKVSYRILWLEALLNESRLELALINNVLGSSPSMSEA